MVGGGFFFYYKSKTPTISIIDRLQPSRTEYQPLRFMDMVESTNAWEHLRSLLISLVVNINRTRVMISRNGSTSSIATSKLSPESDRLNNDAGSQRMRLADSVGSFLSRLLSI